MSFDAAAPVAFSAGGGIEVGRRLLDRGVDVEVLVLPDEVHGFHRHASWLKAYAETAAFLSEHLGSAPVGERVE